MNLISSKASKKQLAIAEAVRQLVSKALLSRKEVYHPLLEDQIMTFPFAKITPDLRVVRIYTDCLDESALPNVIRVLKILNPAIKKLIASELKLRHVPDIEFVKDDITLKEKKISEAIDNIFKR